jgi:hypothetical protein
MAHLKKNFPLTSLDAVPEILGVVGLRKFFRRNRGFVTLSGSVEADCR